jgi:hypothetical protein
MIESCDLALFPMNTNPTAGSAIGLCDIPSLKLGPMVVANPPCMYEQMQWQFRVLGIPLCRYKILLLGLDFLCLFSNVRFDNVRHEVLFDPNGVFASLAIRRIGLACPSPLWSWTSRRA